MKRLPFSKLVRWGYVLPRVIVVLVVVVAIRYGLDAAIGWSLATSGEAALGAKFDVGEVRTDLFGGKITVRDVAAANPRHPMKNLFASDQVELTVDVNALFHKRMVVTSGLVTGLQFDTNRRTSGALGGTDANSDEDSGNSLLSPLANAATLRGAAWLDGVNGRVEQDFSKNLQSPQLAKELEARWPHQYESLQAQAKALRQRAREIEQGFREVRANPLRNVNRLATLQQDLAAADSELRSLVTELNGLPGQIENDRRAIAAAKAHDEQFLRDRLQIDGIDGEQISHYLLGAEAEGYLATALEWVAYARNLVPTEEPIKDVDRRGVDIDFTKTPCPRWLVQQVDVQGVARLAGKPLALTGTLRDVSSQPWLHDRPARLQLVGAGPVAVKALVELDRRQEVPLDSIRLECDQLAMPGKTLGRPEKISVSLAPGEGSLHAEVRLDGDRLAGIITLQQSHVELQPAVGATGDLALASAIAESLKQIDGFEASMLLSGTMGEPQWKLKSDLGPQLAAGVNGALRQYAKQQSDRLLAKAQADIDARLARLTRMRQDAQQQLLAQLGEHQHLLAALAPMAGAASQGGGGFSLPRIGKLPASTLLK
jgi:uncharacterized protein (TIGR03545 family)